MPHISSSLLGVSSSSCVCGWLVPNFGAEPFNFSFHSNNEDTILAALMQTHSHSHRNEVEVDFSSVGGRVGASVMALPRLLLVCGSAPSLGVTFISMVQLSSQQVYISTRGRKAGAVSFRWPHCWPHLAAREAGKPSTTSPWPHAQLRRGFHHSERGGEWNWGQPAASPYLPTVDHTYGNICLGGIFSCNNPQRPVSHSLLIPALLLQFGLESISHLIPLPCPQELLDWAPELPLDKLWLLPPSFHLSAFPKHAHKKGLPAPTCFCSVGDAPSHPTSAPRTMELHPQQEGTPVPNTPPIPVSPLSSFPP